MGRRTKEVLVIREVQTLTQAQALHRISGPMICADIFTYLFVWIFVSVNIFGTTHLFIDRFYS
jgi:hypothetical protein